MPEQPVSPPLVEPNPITRRAHRQQSFWQIKLPIIICIVLVGMTALMVFIFGFGRGNSLSSLSDVSIMWLIIPIAILATILIVVQVALIYMLVRLLPGLPRSTRQAQDFFMLLSFQVRKISDKSTEPFLRAHSLGASLGAFWQSVRRSFRRSGNNK